MVRFFVPQNIQDVGLIKSGTRIVLLDINDIVLLGAETSVIANARLILVTTGLAITNVAQDKIVRLDISSGDDGVLTVPTGQQFKVVIGTNDRFILSSGGVVLLDGHTSVPTIGLGTPTIVGKNGLFVVPTTSPTSRFVGIECPSAGPARLIYSQLGIGVDTFTENLVVRVFDTDICDFQLVSGAASLGMKSNKIVSLAAGTASTDAVNKAQLDGKVDILSTDGSGRPRVVVSDDTTDLFQAVNQTSLKAKALAYRKNVNVLGATGSYTITADDDVIVGDNSIVYTITLPDAGAADGRELIFKLISTGATMNINPVGADSMESQAGNFVQINAKDEFVRIIPINSDNWIIVGGTGFQVLAV